MQTFANPPRKPKMFSISEHEMIAEIDRAWRLMKRKITKSSQVSEEDRQILNAIHWVIRNRW